MPVLRWSSSLFSLAAAALLASALAAPAQAQVSFGYGYPAAWGYYTALSYSYYGRPWAIAFPGYARAGGWPVAGFPFISGLQGAAGRLYPR